MADISPIDGEEDIAGAAVPKLDTQHSLAQAARGELRELAPPDDNRRRHENFVAEWGEFTDALMRYRNTLDDPIGPGVDPRRVSGLLLAMLFVEQEEKAEKAVERLDEAARAHGAHGAAECAEIPWRVRLTS